MRDLHVFDSGRGKGQFQLNQLCLQLFNMQFDLITCQTLLENNVTELPRANGDMHIFWRPLQRGQIGVIFWRFLRSDAATGITTNSTLNPRRWAKIDCDNSVTIVLFLLP